MKGLQFDCSRTCPQVKRGLCQFSPIFAPIGSSVVNSHTTTVHVEFKSREALIAAAEKLNMRVLGEGTHSLYSSKHTGFALHFPNWNYPVIAGKDGNLHYDTYNGVWGNEADVRRLTSQYAIEAARQAALAQGWVSQDQADGSLLIYHPESGTMTVRPDGTVESSGFVGQGCDAARVIEEALGSESTRSNKAEYFSEKALIQVQE